MLCNLKLELTITFKLFHFHFLCVNDYRTIAVDVLMDYFLLTLCKHFVLFILTYKTKYFYSAYFVHYIGLGLFVSF